ncbi:MAG: penicillin-binding transpeptidase domain-containing protein, partial [Fimbriimonadaceae bacterium]
MVHRDVERRKMGGRPNRLPRAVLFPFVFLFLVAALAQARVQIFGSKDILDRGTQSGRHLVTQDESARRGSIWTSDGRLLAHDVEASELGVHFGRVPRAPGFFLDLGEASGIPAAEFERLASSASGWRFWRDAVSPSRAAAIQSVKRRWKADGISLRRIGERRYPMREAAAGIVGFLIDSEPKAGLELSKNDVLSGRDGRTIGLVDRGGAFLPMRLDDRTVPRVDGQDIVLTIDSQLQLAAGTAIRNAVESNGAAGGAIVVMDPKTGDLWAMAHWPSLDPMRLGEPVVSGERPSSLNLAYRGLYEPGSTLKILTLAEALELGVTRPDEIIPCSGSLRVVGRQYIRCAAHGGVRAHGPTDPEQAIARSCNVSAATWALRIGHERMVAFLDQTGLLTRTNLGLPFEQRGRFDRDAPA